MAAVKCRRCGYDNDPGDDSCAYCGNPLPRRRASAGEEVTAQEPQPGAAQAPQANAGQAAGVRDDPFATTMGVTLRLPNGRVITLEPGDRLMVGRSQDSPMADICTDNISRVHAFITVRGDGAYLTDSRSTNGTYLNGSRLEPDREYRLTGSAGISFGADPPLRIDVEVGES
jgi:pSer/pThr/pTyr-binding forkhead associated (FHA) protein